MNEIEKKKSVLEGVEESMLITLAARAKESKEKNPLFKDEIAEKIYEKLSPYIKEEFDYRAITGSIIRTVSFDQYITSFIEKNPKAAIINLGAGLDSRFFRIDNKEIIYYDVDLPRVMSIRKELIPEHERSKQISGNLLYTDFYDEINTEGREVLIVIEGVLQYFTVEEVKKILENLANKFPNSHILFDMCSEYMLNNDKMMKNLTKSDLVFKWGEDDPKNVEKLNDKYELLDFINLADKMQLKMKFMKIGKKFSKIRKMSTKVALYKIKDK